MHLMNKQKQKKNIKQIVKKYVQSLEELGLSVQAAYLYGSYAQGNPKQHSDIDICIISPQYKRFNDKDRLKLWRARRPVDTRIEPIGYSPEDFEQNWLPLVNTIKKQGIKII